MSTALTTISDQESMLGMMPQSVSVNSAIQLASALIDKRIATARNFPRKISRFKQETADLLREDKETARSAEYAKPVGGGTVRGASIRLAELAAMCWGNLDIQLSEPIVGDKSVTVQATAYDLERNYQVPGIATASIVGRNGRYPQHMIETTILACASKARRNAILSVIPKAYITDLLAIAKEVAEGNKKPLEEVRKDLLEYFARTHKVTAEQIFETLNISGIDDIGEPQLEELRLAANAIKEGEAKPEDFFQTKAASKADAVKAKIAERASSKQGKLVADPVDTSASAK